MKLLARMLEFDPAWAYGSANRPSQLRMLGKILTADFSPSNAEVQDALMLSALSLARWAWQQHPLNREVLKLVSVLEEAGAGLGGMAGVAAETEAVLASVPGLAVPERFETPDALAEFMRALPEFGSKRFLRERFEAEQAVAHNPENAESLFNALDSSLFGFWKAGAHLELVQKKGPSYFDSEMFGRVWSDCCWHTNLILALFDLLYPAKLGCCFKEQAPPPILLYSWNKRDALFQTLESLRASNIEGAPVFVLDNGSTDNSLEMLLAQKDKWGTPFTVISLAANVGAPAARNWLLSLPEVRGAPWAVFLDDDVILEKNWLQGLCGTAAANPGYGAVGYRVTDHIPPFGIQAADFHLLSADEATHSFEDMDERIFPFCSAMGEIGEAFYAYTRPCVSVTGCCHLINMEAVERAGPFDVRFNPSQFDDLERDLRSSLAGFPTYYHGQVVVRHMQHSSLRQAMGRPQQGHIMGNKIKLEFLFGGKRAEKLRLESFERVKADLLCKCARVEQALGGGA